MRHMGGSGSSKQKKKSSSMAAENVNKVTFPKHIMEQVNIHRGTLAVSMAAAVVTIINLALLYE